jgi:hypothetical protein
MLKDLAEMKGQSLPSQVNIQALEMQLANLIVRIKKLKAFLVKLGAYSDLEDLAIEWCLDVESFGNLDGIIERFLKYDIQKTDRFTKDDIELFVQLISLVKEKTLRKRELDKLRLEKIRVVVAPVPPASPSAPSPVATPKTETEAVLAVAPTSVANAEVPTHSQPEILESNLDSSQLEAPRATNAKANEILVLGE